MTNRQGAFGHATDAIMLAAEAEEHLLLAQVTLFDAGVSAGASGGLHGAGYALDGVSPAIQFAGGPGGDLSHTAAGLHADANAFAHDAAQQAAASAAHAQAAGQALAGTSGDTPPPQ